MRGLLIFGILLAFPVLELYLVSRIAGEVGWEITLAWLFIAATSGVLLIRGQRGMLVRRIVGVLQHGQSLSGALFAGIRPFLAGILLVFPGPLTDALAIGLLLIPAPIPPPVTDLPPREDGVIEGEWRREETYTEGITLENPHGQESPASSQEDRPDPGSRETDRRGSPR